MKTWPIALSTGSFHQRSIFEALPLIAESGFTLVEICSWPPHLDYHDVGKVRRAAEMLADLEMKAVSFHAPFADRIDISSPDSERRESAVMEIFRAATAAAELGARNFVIHPGPEHAAAPLRHDAERRLGIAVGTLRRVIAKCRELGVRCLLENKLPHLLFGSAGEILQIMERLQDQDAGICLDTGHAHLGGEMLALLHKLSPYLIMIHAHDNRGSYDDHLPPGEGQIDWAHFLGELWTIGFDGSIVLELAGGPAADATLAGARRARSFLQDLTGKTRPPHPAKAGTRNSPASAGGRSIWPP